MVRAKRILDRIDCELGVAVDLALTVKNNGPYPSKPVRVATQWPSNFISEGIGSCFDSCLVPALNPGQTVSIKVTGAVSANSPDVVSSAISTLDPAQTLFDSIVNNNQITLGVCL